MTPRTALALLCVVSLVGTACAGSEASESASRRPYRGNNSPAAKSAAAKALAKIRPKWWRGASETTELEQVNAPTPRNDPFVSFDPKRPQGGYAWNQEAWHGQVMGKCAHCNFSTRVDPSKNNFNQPSSGDPPPGSSEDAPQKNAGSPSLPFPLPHQWVHKVPKGLLGFREIRADASPITSADG